MIIRSKAPLRVSFGGGGTDVPPYPDLRGGAVLNATIDKHVYASLTPTNNGEIHVTSLDLDTTLRYDVTQRLDYDGHLDFVKAIVKLMNVDKGFDLLLHCDAPPGCGLGTSSAEVVAIIGAFREWLSLPLGTYDIAELAYKAEREEVKLAGGRQDQYASTHGGINFIEFLGRTTIVNPLRIPSEIIAELQYRSILCYTGKTRLSAGIIQDQSQRLVQGQEEALKAFDETKALAFSMKNSLLLGKLSEFGKLLDQGWLHKKKFSPMITSQLIDKLYAIAIESGALGGKLLGAGGGGFLFVFCDINKKQNVAKSLVQGGGQIMDFSLEFQGLQSWVVKESPNAI